MLKKGEVKMIHKMLKDGLSKVAIARKLGINRNTVTKYAKLPEGYIPVIKREAVAKNGFRHLKKIPEIYKHLLEQYRL